MIRMIVGVLAGLALGASGSGCAGGGEDQVKITDLAGRAVARIYIAQNEVTASLSPQHADVNHCPKLSARSGAKLNGEISLDVQGRGGLFTAVIPGQPFSEYPECSAPKFVLGQGQARPPWDEHLTTLAFVDETGAAGVDIQNAWAPRQLVLESPSNGQIHSSDLVRVKWSVETDAVDGRLSYCAAGTLPTDCIDLGAAGSGNLWTFSGGQLPAGAGKLVVDGAAVSLQVSRCDFAACDVSSSPDDGGDELKVIVQR